MNCMRISTGITVTGDEWWLKFHGQADELPWPQEEVDDDSLMETYGNIPWLTLSPPLRDEDYVSKGQITIGGRRVDPQIEGREPMTRMRNQGCVTNTVRVEEDLAERGRETIQSEKWEHLVHGHGHSQ